MTLNSPISVEGLTVIVNSFPDLPKWLISMYQFSDGISEINGYINLWGARETIKRNENIKIDGGIIIGSDGSEELFVIDNREASKTGGKVFAIRRDDLNWEKARFMGDNAANLVERFSEQ